MSSLRSFYRTASVGAGIVCACALLGAQPAGPPREKGIQITLAAHTLPVAEPPAPLVETFTVCDGPEAPHSDMPPPVAPMPGSSSHVDASLPDRSEIVQEARKLCEAVQKGRLRLTNSVRETEQLHCLMNAGAYSWPAAPQPAQAKRASSPSRQGSPDRNVQPGDSALQDKSLLPAGPLLPDEAPAPAIPPEIISVPSQNLLRMLNALAAHSTTAHPLELMSLLRPPYRTARFQHAGPGNPHSLGLAADIASYDGCRIRQDRPEECVKMTLALLRDLPPGRYRLGMPKSPEIPAIVGVPQLPQALIEVLKAVTAIEPTSVPAAPFDLTPPAAPLVLRNPMPLLPSFSVDALQPGAFGAAIGLYSGISGRPWPFFPPPEFEMENGVVAPLLEQGRPVLGGNGLPLPHLLRFRNESYAPEEELAEPRLRDALLAARNRGVDVIALFPDAADHIHVDVKQVR